MAQGLEGSCGRGRAGHLLALHVTPADEQDRAQVNELAAAEHGIRLEVVKHTEARRGFVLLPRRWVVE